MLGPGSGLPLPPLNPVSSQGHAGSELPGRTALGVTRPTCRHFHPHPRCSLHSQRH